MGKDGILINSSRREEKLLYVDSSFSLDLVLIWRLKLWETEARKIGLCFSFRRGGAQNFEQKVLDVLLDPSDRPQKLAYLIDWTALFALDVIFNYRGFIPRVATQGRASRKGEIGNQYIIGH